MLAESRATVSAAGGTFFDNGQGHFAVNDRSVGSVSEATIGQDGDATALSVFAGRDSRVEVQNQVPAILHGRALAQIGSNLLLQGTTAPDGVTLQDFSWVKLDGSGSGTTVACEAGSDAICAAGSVAAVSGCGPVSASCSGRSSSTGGSTPPALPFRMSGTRPGPFRLETPRRD